MGSHEITRHHSKSTAMLYSSMLFLNIMASIIITHVEEFDENIIIKFLDFSTLSNFLR